MIINFFKNNRNDRLGLLAAMVLFSIIAVAQIWRALAQVAVDFGGHSVPLWLSVVAGLVAAAMACWMGSILRHNRPVI